MPTPNSPTEQLPRTFIDRIAANFDNGFANEVYQVDDEVYEEGNDPALHIFVEEASDSFQFEDLSFGFTPELRESARRAQLASDYTAEPTAEKIIWAIDAFPDDLNLHRETAAAIAALWPNAEIFPIYVLSEENFNQRGYTAFLKPALKPMALKAMDAVLDDVRTLPSTAPLLFRSPRVLIEHSTSRPACARKLLKFAKKVGATQVAVGSHARGVLARFFVGSFSDSILQNAPLPVLIIGPHAKTVSSAIHSLVFATDFSSACRQVYEQILDMAEEMDAELHLFHKPMPAPLDLYALGGAQMLEGGWMGASEALEQSVRDQDRDVQHWIDHAQRRGIRCRAVSTGFGEPTADAIVKYCNLLDPSSTLVALVSQTGPIASSLFGSVSRDVIRESSAPVYLLPRLPESLSDSLLG